jgi:integrase
LHGHRHSFGTLLLLGGVDIKVVSELMRHSSSSVTREIYQQVIPRLRKEAGAAFDTLIGGVDDSGRDQIGDQ